MTTWATSFADACLEASQVRKGENDSWEAASSAPADGPGPEVVFRGARPASEATEN